jgi:hypothetical protein
MERPMAGGGLYPDLPTLLTLGVSAAAVGCVVLFTPRGWRARRRVVAVGAVLAILGAAAFAVQLPVTAWLAPAGFGAFLGLVYLLGSNPARVMAGRVRMVAVGWRFQGAALLAAGLGLMGWCLVQAEPEVDDLKDPVKHPVSVLLAEMRQDPNASAVTDRGRRVRLFRPPVETLPSEALVRMEEELTRGWAASLTLIRTGPPDWAADCHGWTFATGRYWITGKEVEPILEDNGYLPATCPQTGDLVVYRDAQGQVTHTGVVFSVGEAGRILVESKWAWMGCYLHAPEAQPYGNDIRYYRSARPGHLLRIRTSGVVSTDPSQNPPLAVKVF